MMNATDQTNSPHYFWGGVNEGWRLLDSGSLSVIHERLQAGSKEQKHYHEKTQQYFFILSGEAKFYFEKESVIVKTKQGIHIPAGTVHYIANESADAIEFLVISEPAVRNDRKEL